jgi:ABC-type dipeptide/oligopeptide/nickel transport system permease component
VIAGGATILRRLLFAVPTLLVVSVVLFIALRVIPADPLAMPLPPGATEAEFRAMRTDLGFDRPILEQYGIWLAHLVRGDLGISIHFHQKVSELIAGALPTTLELLALGLPLGILLGLGGGLLMFGARRSGGGVAIDLASIVLMSIPEFLWALLLLLAFGVGVHALPFIGRIDPQLTVPQVTGFMFLDTLIALRPDAFVNALAHLLLPAAALGLALAPIIMRTLRSSLLATSHEDYVALARLRGLSETRILLGHAFKNAALPTVSLIGVQAGFMFGGTLLVEVIYTLPGIGNLLVEAIGAHDLPLIEGLALVYCLVVLAISLLVDIACVALDPRLRTS